MIYFEVLNINQDVGGYSMPKKVISFIRPYIKLMIIAWMLMLIELAVELTAPILMAKIIDEGVLVHEIDVVIEWGIWLLIITLIAFVAGITNSFFAAFVSQNFGFDIRNNMYSKIQNLSFHRLVLYPTANLITRLINDVTQIQHTIFIIMRIALRAPLLVLLGTIMAFLVNWKIALVFIFTIPVIIFFLFYMMKLGIKNFRSVQKRLDQVNRIIRENLKAMRIIKAFYRKESEVTRFIAANHQLKIQTMKTMRMIELNTPILLFIMNVSIVVILWYGNVQLQIGGAGAGEVVAIVNYATRITGSLSNLSWIIMAFARAKASNDRMNEILMMEEEKSGPQSVKQPIKGKIQFKDVYFSYDENHNKDWILKSINFTVEPGQKVAIMGSTGSGKTSLFQLIPKLFEPNSGQLLIDGKNIKVYNSIHLRNQIGYVPQEPHLFSGTIKENIAWGKQDATMDEIVEAAKDAQIHSSILQFPKQYDTVIGQKGVNLSGGQKQRLTIARALVRKPKILLLDDSTSALDMQTERELILALNKCKCTILIITQKISTAKQLDFILLLDDGEVIAQGTHEQLLKNSKLYQKIYTSQLGKEVFK